MLTSTMPQNLRVLYLKIWDGVQPMHSVMVRLHYLDSFFPRNKLEFALIWLVQNRLVGKNFITWFEGDCSGSNLEMHRRLMAAAEKEKELRTMLAQKDLRLD